MTPLRKTLIYFGLGNIFLIIILVGYLLYFNFNDSENKSSYHSNFESVDYAKNMLKALVSLDDMQTNYFFNSDYKFELNLYANDVSFFKKYLEAEETNITEKREKDNVRTLKLKFESYVKVFDTVIKQNNHQGKVYFSKLLPLQNELIDNLNNIYVSNFYAMMSKNAILSDSITKVIFSLMLFFELILFFVLYRFSKSIYKNTSRKEKNGPKREASDYPKYFSSNSSSK